METKYLHWILSLLITIGLSASGWSLNQAYSKIERLNDDVVELKITTEKTTSNRFTSNDWLNQKTVLDEQRIVMEKRMVTVEECNKQIMQILGEIKQDLRELKERP